MARLDRVVLETSRRSLILRQTWGLELGFCLLAVFLIWTSATAQGNIVAGIITANNVDITTDTGEILPERLSVGDSVYVVTSPGKVRRGWVRVSRSPNDSVGIGWVEEKNIRTYQVWEGGKSTPAPAMPSPAPMDDDFLNFSFNLDAFGGRAA